MRSVPGWIVVFPASGCASPMHSNRFFFSFHYLPIWEYRRRCSRLPLVKVVPSNPTAMSTPDPLGELQAYSSQDQPDAPQSAGTSPSGEDADHGLLVLRKIFDEGHSTEDLPKGFFYLDRDEIDEEAAEVSTSEF